jgi:ferredoxin
VSRLELDPIRCTGHGLCAELLPEGISLDEWGYPILAAGEIPEYLLRQARQVAAACPTRALRLSARHAQARSRSATTRA